MSSGFSEEKGEARRINADPAVIVLSALYAVCPLTILVSLLVPHYTIALTGSTLWAGILLDATAVCAVVLSLRRTRISAVCSVVTALLPFAAMINAFCMLDPLSEISGVGKLLLCLSLFLCTAGTIYICVRFTRKRALMIAALSVSAVFLVPLAFFTFIACTFGSIGEKTVVRSIPSPDGALVAEVIDDDQGALGGSTQVWVRGSGQGRLMPIVWKEDGIRLYYGKWGMFDTISVEWKDERTLIIDGVEYPFEYP